eukprot:EG_transcript_18624
MAYVHFPQPCSCLPTPLTLTAAPIPALPVTAVSVTAVPVACPAPAPVPLLVACQLLNAVPTVSYACTQSVPAFHTQPTSLTNAQMVAQASRSGAPTGVPAGWYFGNQVAVTTAGTLSPRFGQPPASGALTLAGSQAAARVLDAADGVIDGRHFGAQVGVSHATPLPGGHLTLAPSQAAARALDAADGVIDGQHFGSRLGVAKGGAFALPPRVGSHETEVTSDPLDRRIFSGVAQHRP